MKVFSTFPFLSIIGLVGFFFLNGCDSSKPKSGSPASPSTASLSADSTTETQSEPIDLQMKQLPGELTAEQILNGEYLWPPSPEVEIRRVGEEVGFDPDAFGKAPAPGVHPRLLFSEEDIPDIRKRLEETEIGAKTWSNITALLEKLHKPGTAYSNVVDALAKGDVSKAEALLADYKNAGKGPIVSWHHRAKFAYPFMLDCLQALINDDAQRGATLAQAAATLAQVYQNRLDLMDGVPRPDTASEKGITTNVFGRTPTTQLNSDVWRSSRRMAIDGEPTFAYIYDFAFKWMNDEQRAVCRNTINNYIRGRTTIGSHMPSHFRNWNWIAVGTGLLTFSAATLGEEGNDARVYEHTKQLAYDYLRYGWSQMGSSREAIGYTQFGLRWLLPSMVVMARNGDNYWNMHNFYNSMYWYAHSNQPEPGRFLSHGDGGNAGVSAETALFFKHAYPDNPLVDFILAEVKGGSDDPVTDRGMLMLCSIFAADPDNENHEKGAQLGLPRTFFDLERNQMITRSHWGPDMVKLQMESRPDGTGPNHQHADRGVFSLAGAGRTWAIEHFRGVESRHHNVVTIDYEGQGKVSPPGKWIELLDNEHATFGVTDNKYAYDWYFHPTLSGFTEKDQPRRHFKRWANFTKKNDAWVAENPDYDWKANIDRSPMVEEFWSGYEKGDPRMWDEYARPVRVPHNPVEKAFRTAGLVRGKHPYALVIDDIKKDDQLRTYDWNMMLDPDIGPVSIKLDEILLGPDPKYATTGFAYTFSGKAKKGDPQLFMKVLNRAIPEQVGHNPEIRVETLEFKEARDWPDGRSFGFNKRLVVPSYSNEPKFKMLLYPHKSGEETPQVTWNDDHTVATVEWSDQKDVITFSEGEDGRTRLQIERDGEVIARL